MRFRQVSLVSESEAELWSDNKVQQLMAHLTASLLSPFLSMDLVATCKLLCQAKAAGPRLKVSPADNTCSRIVVQV